MGLSNLNRLPLCSVMGQGWTLLLEAVPALPPFTGGSREEVALSAHGPVSASRGFVHF